MIASVVAELGARWVGPQLPSWRGADTKDVIMVGHSTRLWGMAEGVRNNAGATATINEAGLRGWLPEGPREEGEQRIMVLGDSTFFGHGVNDEETLQAVLEGRLQARGLNARVLNGGVPGYSTEQTRLVMEEVGWDMDPSLLVLGNLWSDNNWDLFRDKDLLRTARVFHGPLARSSFYQLLAGFLDRLGGGDGAHIVTWTRTSEWPEEGVRRVSLRRYAENLDWLAREAARRGVGVLVLQPANVEVVGSNDPDSGFSWAPYFEAQRALASPPTSPTANTSPSTTVASNAVRSSPGQTSHVCDRPSTRPPRS
ncbi:MAG: hypothetical protein QGG40_07025, partial [Myxococcota bacterium]|nr:hypothetical protein [Myxococcota bacterium]